MTKTWEKSLKLCEAWYIFLAILIVLPSLASSQATYKFERMWPTLKQPWYFYSLFDLATDPKGNIYVTDLFNSRVLKFSQDGAFITTWGSFGDGAGEFKQPHGIAVYTSEDDTTYVYVVDMENHRVQKFNSDGTWVDTWGGPDAGVGIKEFNYPRGIAADAEGNIYVTETGNDRIQKFSADGTWSATWEKPQWEFSSPASVATDAEGNIYVADTGNDRIQKFNSNGDSIPWGSPALNFNSPLGIAVYKSEDDTTHVYVADTGNHRIQKLTSDGGYLGEFKTERMEPKGIAVSPEGYIYVVDYTKRSILRFTPDGTFLSSWGAAGSSNGTLFYPQGIAVDTEGTIYVADSGNHRIQKFDQDGLYSTQWGSYGSANGAFNQPEGIAIDSEGNIYVADTYNHRIQKFDSGNDWIETWGSPGYDFEEPYGVTVYESGSDVYVYVADTWNHRIQKFNSEGDYLNQWGSPGSGNRQFLFPEGIAADADGNIYVADTGNDRILKFNSEGDYLDQWGNYGEGNRQFKSPRGIAADPAGNIYVADRANHRIQKFDSNGGFITTWGGFGIFPGQMSYPAYLAAGAHGRIYVTDARNHRIQVFKEVTLLKKTKAIIVAGRKSPEDSLWDATQATANFAYRTLIYRGLQKGDIRYLSSNTTLDFEGDGVADVTAVPTEDTLRDAITEWAVDENADSLVLYFSDHGSSTPEGGIFHLNEQETLASDDLASWLETIEGGLADRIVVIIDACESGSFLDDLEGDDRIVITSTSPGERAKFLSQGTISFSSFFLTHIFSGLSIDESFLKARRVTTFAFDNQNPLLSGLAENIYLGNESEQMIGDAPRIEGKSPSQKIEEGTSEEIYADVTDPNGDSIARVWAVIWSPDLDLGSVDTPLLDQLQDYTIELLPDSGNRYKGTYGGFNQDAIYPVVIYAMDGNNNTSIPEVTLVSRNYARRAIIVEGKGEDDAKQSAMRNSAELAYHALKSQLYNDDDIYFMSVSGISGFDGIEPSREFLEHHILHTLGGDESIENLDLLIYLTGGGGEGTVTISSTDTLSASDHLAGWLNTLQNSIPSCKVTLIYDGDKSGSFIPVLTPPEGKERILITSSGAGGPAYFSPEGDISFSSFFLSQVSIGATLYNAFAYADNAISYFSLKNDISFSCYNPQSPLIDADGDGVANEDADYQIAEGRTIGIGMMFADDTPPSIGSVSVEETEDGILICAEDITPTDEDITVWAVIRPIAYCGNIQEYSGEKVAELDEVELLGPDQGGRYKGTYSDLPDAYKIVVYAKDGDSNISSPKETKIYQTEGGDMYEPDDTSEEANVIVVNHTTPQPHNFHYPGDEDWVKFYGLTEFIDPSTGKKLVYTYIIKASNLGDDCEPVIELYSEDATWYRRADTIVDNSVWIETELPWEGIYYVRLLHQEAGEWDGTREYDLQVYNKDAGGLPERVYGKVEDQMSREPIHGAKITTESGGTISTYGEYHFMQIPGEWNLEARYKESFFHARIEVNSGHPLRKDIRISSSATTTVPLSGCTTDEYCSDGRFCNGIEKCVQGYCQAGNKPCADDELFCNGEEWCDEESDMCVSSSDPCSPDLKCDEGNDVCTGCFEDADCNDELFCTGEETCEAGVCQPGTYPCQGGEECDEENDVCRKPPIPCSISIEPEITEIVSGQSRTFTINETGDCINPDYEWSVDSAIGSRCDQNGNYVAGINNNILKKVTDVVRVVEHTSGSSAEATVTVSRGLGCFLSLLYGEGSEEVKVLRHFRDEVLDTTPEGKEIIRLYYEWSQAILQVGEDKKDVNEMLKTVIDGMLPFIKGAVE